MLLLFGLVVAFSRTTTATQHVAHAAAVGARAAVTAQTAGGGVGAWRPTSSPTRSAQVGMTCAAPSVAGDFTPGGRVTVSVSCDVDLGDVTKFGLLPGSRTLTASATEVIDRTRGGGA